MRLVVADTGPLNYLVLIGESDILPKLFEIVLVPEAVHTELRHRDAPPTVRAWADRPPAWLDIRPVPAAAADDPTLRALDDGERAALALARALGADLILMDDRAAVAVAHEQGFAVTGTLGILDLAARRGLLDLGAAFARLKGRISGAALKLWTHCLRNGRNRRHEPARPLPSRRTQRQLSRRETVAVGLMNRLRAMAAAMAASRDARAAESERQRANPEFSSQKGGVQLTWLSASWPLATLSGDRDSLRLWCPAGVFSLNRLFVFPRSRIRRLSKHFGIFSVGLRIEHTDESYPEFIVFTVLNFAKLKSKLTRLGYDVHDWGTS